jgi:hypothetical protein
VFQELFHKGTTSEDPLVRKIGLPSSAELMDSFPSSSAPDEPPTLKFGPATERDACRHEVVIPPFGTEERGAEMCQHRLRCLPGAAGMSQKDTMTGPRVSIEGGQIGHHSRSERIQVEIADELQKVWVLFDDNRLEPVLEQVTSTPVAAIECAGVAGEKRAHDAAE